MVAAVEAPLVAEEEHGWMQVAYGPAHPIRIMAEAAAQQQAELDDNITASSADPSCVAAQELQPGDIADKLVPVMVAALTAPKEEPLRTDVVCNLSLVTYSCQMAF